MRRKRRVKHQEYDYRPYITTRSGRRIWAKWYGLKAFRIPRKAA